MALRREIDHSVRFFLLNKTEHALSVADIQLDKAKVRVVLHAFQRAQVSRVGQLVDADDPVPGMLSQMIVNVVAADKAGASCNDNRHSSAP